MRRSLCSIFFQVDLIILPLTSVPLVGFWKLLPTFGGCIATKATCSLAGDNNEVIEVCVACVVGLLAAGFVQTLFC